MVCCKSQESLMFISLMLLSMASKSSSMSLSTIRNSFKTHDQLPILASISAFCSINFSLKRSPNSYRSLWRRYRKDLKTFATLSPGFSTYETIAIFAEEQHFSELFVVFTQPEKVIQSILIPFLLFLIEETTHDFPDKQFLHQIINYIGFFFLSLWEGEGDGYVIGARLTHLWRKYFCQFLWTFSVVYFYLEISRCGLLHCAHHFLKSRHVLLFHFTSAIQKGLNSTIGRTKKRRHKVNWLWLKNENNVPDVVLGKWRPLREMIKCTFTHQRRLIILWGHGKWD